VPKERLEISQLDPTVGLVELFEDFRFKKSLLPLAAFAAIELTIFKSFGWTTPVIVFSKFCIGYGVAHYFLAACRKVPGTTRSSLSIAIVVLSAIVFSGFVSSVVAVAPRWWMLGDFRKLLAEWLQGIIFTGLFVSFSMASRYVRRRQRLELEQLKQLSVARLQALQSQIEPHFLMNTLANLRSLIRRDSDNALVMLDHLADLFQGSLKRSRELNSTVGEELDFLSNYLAIMCMRFGDRLSYQIRCSDANRMVAMPPLLLQPLVENSIKHGIEPKVDGGAITIEVNRDDNMLIITVTDNGQGIASSNFIAGIGVSNVKDRLATQYGQSASLTIAANQNGGTIATIRMPVRNA
jgi:sensor histidine kinase YesM